MTTTTRLTAVDLDSDRPRSGDITTSAVAHDAGENMQVTATIQTVSTPPWPAPPARTRTWPAYVLGIIAVVLAAVTLFTRPAAPASPPASAPHSASDISAAERRMCDAYRLAASEVAADTRNGAEMVIARLATTNAAVLLDVAASDPALDPKLSDAGRALSAAYAKVTASSSGGVATDQQYQEAIADSAAKAATLRDMCNA